MSGPSLVGPYALAVGCISIVCISTWLLSPWLLSSRHPPPKSNGSSEEKYRSASSNKLQALPRIQDTSSEVDLSVIIPAFNEIERLPTMLAQTLDHLSQFPERTCEILIVDDGSDDGTADLALEIARKHPQWCIRVISLARNRGKGGAVRHGMLHARGSRLLMVDADGASQFKDLEVLWGRMDDLLKQRASAVVIGSRAHLVKTEAVVKRSMLRNCAMYGLHTTLRFVGVGHIRDTQCGFKLFSREAARRIFPYQHIDGWIFDVELLMLAKYQNIPVAEMPISWVEVPESKLKVVRDSLLMFRDLVVLRLNYLTGRWTVPTT